jgi:4-amino-4-deoxy-L-arabinose transferase-like glycosyltransferase
MTENKNTFTFYGVVFLLIVINYLIGSTVFPLFDLDEGAYAEVSRQMVVSGDYLSTIVNGIPFYDKPALMYWVQSLSISLFGNSEFAYRFPSIIALVVWLVLIFQFVKNELDEKTAQYSVLIALSSAGVTVLFKAAIPDAFLNLFITATLFQAYLFVKDSNKKHIYYAYFFMALGVLTKGPIAIVIPFFTITIFLVYKQQYGYLWKMISCWKGWGIFLIIGLPWYVVQYIQFGDAFIEGFFGKHNVGRFMNAMEGHTGGIFFYVGALLMLSLPYTVLLITAFIKIKDVFKHDVILFFWIWFVFVFVFFTISATKLPHYLMYGLTPIWIVLAYYLVQAKSFFWGLVPAIATLMLLIIFPSVIEYISTGFDDLYVQQTYQNLSQDLPRNFYLIIVVSLLSIVVLSLMKRVTPDKKLIAAGVMCSFAITFSFLPMVGNFQQGAIKKAGLYAKKHNLNVVVWGLNMPSFNVYAQRTSEIRKPKVGEIVLTKTEKLKVFKQVNYLINHRGIALAEINQ